MVDGLGLRLRGSRDKMSVLVLQHCSLKSVPFERARGRQCVAFKKTILGKMVAKKKRRVVYYSPLGMIVVNLL